jgi:RNA recognition motif-containing protein
MMVAESKPIPLPDARHHRHQHFSIGRFGGNFPVSSDSEILSLSSILISIPISPVSFLNQSAAGILNQSATGSFGYAPSAVMMQYMPPARPKRLHVSNIPFKMNSMDLEFVFRHFGPVSEAEIISNAKGSKGFGFVTFARTEHADEAKRLLHHTVIDGRRIEVNDALPRNKFSIVPSDALLQKADGHRFLKELSARHTVVTPDGDLIRQQQQLRHVRPLQPQPQQQRPATQPIQVPINPLVPDDEWFQQLSGFMKQRLDSGTSPTDSQPETPSPTGSFDEEETEYRLFQ